MRTDLQHVCRENPSFMARRRRVVVISSPPGRSGCLAFCQLWPEQSVNDNTLHTLATIQQTELFITPAVCRRLWVLLAGLPLGSTQHHNHASEFHTFADFYRIPLTLQDADKPLQFKGRLSV